MKPITTSLAGLAVFCAVFAATMFSINDMSIKFLSRDYPLHQVVLARSCIGLIVTLAIIMPLEGGFHLIRTKRLGLHLLRGCFVVMANLLFFLGLAELPLSEATAIFFVSPLIITIFSVIFLSEKVGLWRWFAVVMGLVGALILLRPTPSSFQLAGLLPLAAAFCYAGLHVLTRKIGSTERASTMAFYIQICFVITASLMGVFFGDGHLENQDSAAMSFLLREWVRPLPIVDLLIMIGIGCTSALGGYAISQAYRLSEAALIAPFEYLSLVLSVIWGIFIFNEWPDGVAWISIFLIISGGLMMLWRESVMNKKRAAMTHLPVQR